MYVYESVGAALRAAGVTAVFGLMGDGNLRFLSEIGARGEPKYFATRHESAAVAMADGYARSTGRVGVCTVTQGPGLTNTITALRAAVEIGSPMLVLAGAAPSSLPGTFQYIDQEALFATVGAGVHPIRSAKTVAEDIDRAIRRAERERRPIGVFLTGRMQEQLTADLNDTPLHAPTRTVAPHPDAIREAVEVLEYASRPVIIAGAGTVLSGGEQAVIDLADQIGALLATSLQGKGLFVGHPHHIGVSGDLSTGMASELIGNADLIISMGASLNFWTTCSGEMINKGALVLQCDHDDAAIGRFTRATYGVVGDVALTAGALLEELKKTSPEPKVGFRQPAITERLDTFEYAQEFGALSAGPRLDPRTVMLRMEDKLPRERTVALDGGHFLGFPAMYVSSPDPQGFLFAVNFGSIGLSLGTGMGAAVGREDRLAVVMIGDGAMMMSLGDLDTAVRHELPVLVFVVNDAAFGSEVHNLALLGLPTELGYLNDPDFAAIGASMGASSVSVRTIDDLDKLDDWLAKPAGPMVVDCKVDGDVLHPWLEEVVRRQVRYRDSLRAKASARAKS
jgi:thiamine pyrophosphate-dependent acetolactate synthase large subunit-like protein